MTREQRFADDLRRQYPDVRFRDASPLLLAMREIKSPAELTLIQRAIDITVEAQKAAMARVLTATRESEVQATIEFTFRNLGACCWAFPSIVAAGRNATTLHYETNNDPIVRDGLLLTDIGAEVDGYGADVTRTYPADGTLLARAARDLRGRARGAERVAGADAARPPSSRGEQQGDRSRRARAAEARAGDEEHAGTGGALSVSRHRPSARAADARRLRSRAAVYEPGMVFTNEPGVYVRKDDIFASEIFKKLPAAEQTSMRAAVLRYDGIGIRIEDDVLITAGEPKVLSSRRTENRQGHRGVDDQALTEDCTLATDD